MNFLRWNFIDRMEAARKKWDALAKPIDGLGDFEKLVVRIAGLRKQEVPDISKKALIIMCADNGVVKEGVTQCDSSVTSQVAALMTENKSSVGIMTEGYPLDIFPVDIGMAEDVEIEGIRHEKIARGTENIAKGHAMTEDECLQAVSTGINIVKELSGKGYGIIATGEMGIGNTTTAACVASALLGIDPDTVTGRGAGLSDEGLKRKKEVIRQALKINLGIDKPKPVLKDKEYTLKVLSSVGGFDIAALAGVFIGGMLCGIPVVIDGFISAAAALAAEYLIPGTAKHMIASHNGREKGTKIILDALELKPVIDADMALGEGTGAVMIFPLLDMAMNLFRSGTGFDQTDIAEYERFDK